MLYFDLNLPLHDAIKNYIPRIWSLLPKTCQFNGYVKLLVGDELDLLKYMHKLFKVVALILNSPTFK